MAEQRTSEAPSLEPRAPSGQLLPDFCSGETALRVFVVVMILALVVLLLTDGGPDPMLALYPIAFFIIWVAFSSLLVLCLLQPLLNRLPMLWQVVIPTGIPVLNTAIVHWGAEQVFLADSDVRLRVIAVAFLLSLVAMRYFYLVAAWKEETRLVAQAREQALRARVRPHFLYNSMNSIASLCRTDPERAEKVTLDLTDLFRATFATGATHTLAEELELVRAYLEIEQTRFADRLQLEWDVPHFGSFSLLVPTLLLQPLAENAIQHGIAPARAGGRVWVRVREQANHVFVDIGNTVGAGEASGTHTAGADVRARLRHWFGDEAGIESCEDKDGFFSVRVTLPIHLKQGAES